MTASLRRSVSVVFLKQVPPPHRASAGLHLHYLIQRPRVERITSQMPFRLMALCQVSSLSTRGNLAEWIFCFIGEKTDTQ